MILGFRAVAMFGLTLIQFYYWKYRGGGTARIFLGNVKRHPDKVAYYYQEETWTYQQVSQFDCYVGDCQEKVTEQFCLVK